MTAGPWRPRWAPRRAVAAGIVGALVNSLAIRATRAAGIDAGTSGLSSWLLWHLNRWFGATLPTQLGSTNNHRLHALQRHHEHRIFQPAS